MRRKKLLILSLFVSTLGYAQLNSPYSSFGIGDVQPSGVGRNVGMADVGQAIGSDHFINLANPAMLANTSPASLTFFDAGIKNTTLTLKSGEQKQRTKETNLDYFSLAMPLKPYKAKSFLNTWYTAVGISQYSDVNYDISYFSVVDPLNGVLYSLEGKGGFSQAYWSHGFRIKDKYYLGLESSYIFGSVEKVNSSHFLYAGIPDATLQEFHDRISMANLKFKPGIAYRTPLNFCRTKKRTDISCTNNFYRTKKEILEECARKTRFAAVGIYSYDTIRTKMLDTVFGREKKQAERLYRKHQKLYMKKKLEACKNNPNLPKDERNYVYKDTLVETHSRILYGKDIKRIEQNAISGRYLSLIKMEHRVWVAESITDANKRRELYDIVRKLRPDGYGIIIHNEAAEVKVNLEKTFKLQIDSLLDADSSPKNYILSKGLAKEYLTYRSDIYLTFGASYEFMQEMSVSQLSTLQRITTTGNVVYNDTLTEGKGTLTLPSVLHMGIGLEKPAPSGRNACGDRRKSVWAVGLDFSAYQFSEYSSSFDNNNLSNSWRMAIGGEITPDPLADKNTFLNRTIYRAGLSYEKLPFSFEGESVNSYGMTFGVSLNMFEPNSSSSYPKYLNLNFEYANRGYADGLRENRFVMHISFAISNKWFKKYKEGL